VTELSAFSYVRLRLGITARVRVMAVESAGELICRPTAAVNDASRLQQQLQFHYNRGTSNGGGGSSSSSSSSHSCSCSHSMVVLLVIGLF